MRLSYPLRHLERGSLAPQTAQHSLVALANPPIAHPVILSKLRVSSAATADSWTNAIHDACAALVANVSQQTSENPCTTALRRRARGRPYKSARKVRREKIAETRTERTNWKTNCQGK